MVIARSSVTDRSMLANRGRGWMISTTDWRSRNSQAHQTLLLCSRIAWDLGNLVSPQALPRNGVSEPEPSLPDTRKPAQNPDVEFIPAAATRHLKVPAPQRLTRIPKVV